MRKGLSLAGYRGFLTAGTVPSPYNKASSKGYHGFLMNDYEGEGVVTLSYPSPTDSLGIPHSCTHYTLSSAKLQAFSSPMPLGLAAPTRPIETAGLWDYEGQVPFLLGCTCTICSKHKHGPKDNTSADLVIGLWAGRREGAGCPLRCEDGTRGPLCQQLLRHLFPPAFGGFPPPTSEQPCLSCSAGTGSLTPAWGSAAPASTCLPGPGSPEAPVKHGLPALTPLLGLGRAGKGG